MPKVGELLREERERQGLTLRDVEATTSIRMRYLQAIEDGNYAILPGDVYAKGFIRNYAIALGFNEIEFVSMYKLETGSETETNKKQEAAKKTAPSDARASSIAARQAHQRELAGISLPPKDQIQSKKPAAAKSGKGGSLSVFVILFIGVIAIGAYVFQAFFGGETLPANNAENQAVRPAGATAPREDKPAPSPAPPLQPLRLVYGDNGQITVVPGDAKVEAITATAELSGSCWARAVADQREIFSGMLARGQTQRWEARETLYMRFGDISAIKLAVNGLPVQLPAGPVAELTVTVQK